MSYLTMLQNTFKHS